MTMNGRIPTRHVAVQLELFSPTAITIERIYHGYEKWEEYHAGMWRIIRGSERQKYHEVARELMGDSVAFRAAMMRAVYEWTHSCEAHLSNREMNRRAWIGHAGCCIATGSPEDVTRQAWWTLNQEEQDVANQMADEAIAEWERLHAEKAIGH